jgi:hypothetical protein
MFELLVGECLAAEKILTGCHCVIRITSSFSKPVVKRLESRQVTRHAHHFDITESSLVDAAPRRATEIRAEPSECTPDERDCPRVPYAFVAAGSSDNVHSQLRPDSHAACPIDHDRRNIARTGHRE